MKILHCADVHLGSPLVGLGDNGKKRRLELTAAFCDLVDYAAKNTDAMLIAGDLFDSAVIDNGSFAAVFGAFERAKLPVFLIFGNHDTRLALQMAEKMPKNVRLFDKTNVYLLGNVNVYGIDDAFGGSIDSMPSDKFNLLIMHGGIESSDIKKYSALPVDYLALGHYHRYSAESFARGVACYSACPEPRGFDEMGDTGFVIVDTDKRGLDMITRVDNAKRHVVTIKLDVGDIGSDDGLIAKFDELCRDVDKNNYLNLVCFGRRSGNLNIEILRERGGFFAFRLDDQTALDFDIEKLKIEQSIFGEFVRNAIAMGGDAALTEKAIELGLTELGKND